MPPVRSPEIESVVRRVLLAWGSPSQEILLSLVSSDPSLRVLGFDADELWVGPAEFFNVRQAQSVEMGPITFTIDRIEAFEDERFGWAMLSTTMTTAEKTTPLRHTAVLRLEAGVWKVIQWHNSSPVPNRQVFGVDLTTTLDNLVSSVLDSQTELTSKAGSEGTMTLVFTDVVDSTLLTESIGDAAWAQVIGAHESTIRRITTTEVGTVVKFLGDGSMLAFESARAAVRAAIQIQTETVDAQFDVRIGIHTGEVTRTADDLLGLTVNKAARVAAAAPAAGIMVSSTTRDMIGSMDGLHFGEPQIVALKGLSDTHQIIPVDWD
ncbi:MAG: nuclear transport factor 2 family protein [Actinobacteria bacterium]|nr:nuclear transport factor 2 family protein [Actinomycetota bacterium]